MKKIAAVLASILLAACASTPKTDSSQGSPSKEKTNGTQVAAKSEAAISSVAETNVSLSSSEIEANKLAAELQELQKQSVFFDFDIYDIKPEYRDVIQKQAEFIKAHENDVVTVEGNCDERGSTEYNLGLGDRRANAVRKNLGLLGIPASQIKVVSFGEEKPRLPCHEEKCWQENRGFSSPKLTTLI